jgi:hypothetical protein
MKFAVSAISSSEAIEGPEDVEHGKGDLAGFGGVEKADVAQRGQRRRQQAGADVDHGDDGLAAFSVSKIFIWSEVVVMSTISVRSGWKRFSVPRGDSVSKARVGTLLALK